MDNKLVPYATQAAQEAIYSGLPGRENGPADAYRHLLWAAELARQYGYVFAKSITTLHEIDIVNFDFKKGATLQSAAERAMDLHNNEIGLLYGESLRLNGGGSWWDVVQFARGQINAAVSTPNAFDISNPSGRPTSGGNVSWGLQSQWLKNPDGGTVAQSNFPPSFPNGQAWDEVLGTKITEWNASTHSYEGVNSIPTQPVPTLIQVVEHQQNSTTTFKETYFVEVFSLAQEGLKPNGTYFGPVTSNLRA